MKYPRLVYRIALPKGEFIYVNTLKKASRVAAGKQRRPNRGMSHWSPVERPKLTGPATVSRNP